MSQLTLELPDETYQAIVATAKRLGMTAEKWAPKRLTFMTMSVEERKAAMDQLMRFAGSCESTHGNSDNESIDRDLADEAMDPHEEK